MRDLTSLDGETKVVGVIGWPVRHSLSPAMHNAAFAEMGLNWVYVPFEVTTERLGEAVGGVRGLQLQGLNVTVPHKEGVARLVDELDEAAAALGAVNTVHNVGGLLRGYNTDGPGFLRSLAEAGETAEGRAVAILGAGGSARAVACAVAGQGAGRLALVNRTVSRAEEVAALVQRRFDLAVLTCGLDSAQAQGAVREADLVVDCTPTGMHPHSEDPPVVPAAWLREGQCVVDLVYTPRETSLLRAARAAGARVVEGVGMLVHQGAIALEQWTGRPAPVATMREALLAALARREAAAG